MSEAQDEVEGWEVPLCRPLTRRVMFAGVPFFVGVGFVLAVMQIVNLRIFPALALLPPAYLVMRALYARDEWGVDVWVENVGSTAQGKNRMDV
jgi:type IV secretory pathway VirB3-like protein